MIRIYYSKIIYRVFLPYLQICFLTGGIYSLIDHRNDYLFYTKGLTEIQSANKKLAEMKKMALLNEKWAKRYIARGNALLENDKPTAREKRNRREFEKLEMKYR